MIEIKWIAKENRQDINTPNESFSLWGRMIPSYMNEKWGYAVSHFEPQDVTEMRFPDKNYDCDKLCRNSVFIGAYDGDKYVGLPLCKMYFLNIGI